MVSEEGGVGVPVSQKCGLNAEKFWVSSRREKLEKVYTALGTTSWYHKIYSTIAHTKKYRLMDLTVTAVKMIFSQHSFCHSFFKSLSEK